MSRNHAVARKALSVWCVAACITALHGTTVAQTARSVETTTARGEPGTRRVVVEDDATRIEELHVRGEAQRVVVQPKRVNLPAWEIRPDSPGRAASGETRLPRDTANTRMWRVLDF